MENYLDPNYYLNIPIWIYAVSGFGIILTLNICCLCCYSYKYKKKLRKIQNKELELEKREYELERRIDIKKDLNYDDIMLTKPTVYSARI